MSDVIAEDPFSLVVHLSGKRPRHFVITSADTKGWNVDNIENGHKRPQLKISKFQTKRQQKSGGSTIMLRHRPSLGTYLRPVVQIEAALPKEMPPW